MIKIIYLHNFKKAMRVSITHAAVPQVTMTEKLFHQSKNSARVRSEKNVLNPPPTFKELEFLAANRAGKGEIPKDKDLDRVGLIFIKPSQNTAQGHFIVGSHTQIKTLARPDEKLLDPVGIPLMDPLRSQPMNPTRKSRYCQE